MAPCSTPGCPWVIDEQCSPSPMPRPPASTPIRRTPGAPTKAVNMPIALEPPPTHATTTSGSAPSRSAYCAACLVADHPLQVAHELRERMRPDHRADDVVGVGHRGRPVAQGVVHGFLQGLRAGGHRHDLGAEQMHPGDVRRLAVRVLLAHVHDAGQAEQRARGRGRNAVLPGAGLGDDAALAEALGEQRLAERVVDLVRPGVREILALQPDVVAELGGEPRRSW